MAQELRLQACSLVQHGHYRELRDLFAKGEITPNCQNSGNGLAPVHYVAQLFSSRSKVSVEDVDQTVKVLIDFGADFSLSASIKDRRGQVKLLSAMDMVISSIGGCGSRREKYEKGFLPNFEPCQITRTLRSIPVSAPHPDLIKVRREKTASSTSSRALIKASDLKEMHPGIVRILQNRIG